MATVGAMLVPAVSASAGAVIGHECDGDHYDASNPDHILYGRTMVGETTTVNTTTNKMEVDMMALTGGLPPVGAKFVLFWDDHFAASPLGGFTDGVDIEGTNFKDVICATSGDDRVHGRQGNDRIFGFGTDTDWIPGPLGQPLGGDRIWGNKGHDFITAGDETGLGGMPGPDHQSTFGGGKGNDVIYVGDGSDSTGRGSLGDDVILAGVDCDDEGPGGDCYRQLLVGGDGNDILFANGSQDAVLQGQAGMDTLNGGWGDPQGLFGGADNDLLIAGSGAHQYLSGDGGNDTITDLGGGYKQVGDGGDGNDLIEGLGLDDGVTFFAFGGAGDDMIFGGGDHDVLWGDYATGLFYSGLNTFYAGQLEFDVPQVSGSTWRPTHVANTHFVQPGASGNDTIYAGGGMDLVYGGPGNDTAYANEPKTTNPFIGEDLWDFEYDYLLGGDGNDNLVGNCSGDLFPPGDPQIPFTQADMVNGGAHELGGGDTSSGIWPLRALLIEDLNDNCPFNPEP